MGDTGVRHACNIVYIRQCAVFLFVCCHDFPVFVTHHFYVDAFIVGVGVAIVAEQERADLHVLAGGIQCFEAVRCDLNDFTGAKFIYVFIAQFGISKGFEGNAIAFVVFTNEDRQSAHFISGSDDGIIFCQDQNGCGTVNLFLCVEDTGNQIVFLVDQCGDEFCGIDFAGAHCHKLVSMVRKVVFDELISVVDDTDCCDGI